MLRSVVFTVVVVAFASYAASTYLAGRVAKSEPEPAQPALAAAQQPAQLQPSAGRSRIVPGETVRGSGEIEIAADAAGNYETNAEIDGYQLRMVVDTGATYVALTDADATAAAKLITGLERLNRDLSVPTPADYGIDEATWNGKMALMAEQALSSGSPANNPRVPTAAEIVGLYREVWTGAAANR